MGCDGGYSTYDNDNNYNNISFGGCFSGNGKVKLINNSYKKEKKNN